MMPFLLLLLAFIIINSTPPFSRQNTFLIASETKKGRQGKLTFLDQFLQARAPQILTPKNMFLICPFLLTMVQPVRRPPGEYHLRHSFKKSTNILEFLQPPFDIFFIDTTNNNNNNIIYIICYDNGDTLEDKDGNEGDSCYCIGTNVDPEVNGNWSLNQV
jgi:hypothetical protein